MELKKQNGLTKLKKINIVDPEKNTAITMGACSCHCSCYGLDEKVSREIHGQSFDAVWDR